MNEKILEGQIVTEENLGIKAMIGAIVLSTDAHICGAPMAAYHTRKQKILLERKAEIMYWEVMKKVIQ